MVRAEVELERYHVVPVRLEICAHEGAAVHQVAVFVRLREEFHGQFAGCELVRSTHDGGEELLLAGEPVEALHPLAAVTAAAKFDGLLVAFIIEVELGVLRLVLVALLHSRHGDPEVDVEGADVTRDEALAYEGKGIIHLVTALGDGPALLDVLPAGERQAHHEGAVRLLGHDEIEILGLDEFAGIDADVVFQVVGMEYIERSAVVVVVVLDEDGIRLGALGGELHLELVVFESEDLGLGVVGGVERGILEDLG